MKDIITYNYLLDLKKVTINEIDRAKLVKSFMKNNKLSVYGLATKLGVSKTTVENWLVWLEVTPKDYKLMIENGLTSKEMLPMIKKAKKSAAGKSKLEYNQLDLLLEKSITEFNHFIRVPTKSQHTKQLLLDLRNTINRVDIHIEKLNP